MASSEAEFVSAYAKSAAQREAAEKARRAQAVAFRVNGLGSELEDIKNLLEGRSKGRHDSIKVKLLRARNLPIMDFRKSDPYVKFRFCDITKKSGVKRGELNPTWNEEKDKCSFIFKIADLSAEMPALQVDVYDEDLLPGTTQEDDDLLGRVDVVLEGELTIDQPIRRWFTLTELGAPPSGPEGSEAQIELDISFYGSEDRRKEKEGRLRRRRSRLGSEKTSSKGDDLKLNDDSKRMVLLGHVGRMRNPAPDVRRIAIQSISKVAGPRGADLPKLSDWAATLVKNFLERIEKDPVPDVRLDALEALGHTTKPGVPEAIKAVCTAMKDSNRDVRLRAVNMIQYLVNSGDEQAIVAVGSCLEDPDQKVRDAASQILPKLSNEFDEKLVNEALQRLTSMHSVVRKTAVQTLVSVHTKGAPVVIDGLIKAIHDFDGDVKFLAITELAKQAGRGHDGALQAVAEQLDDLRPRIREAATKALAAMATKAHNSRPAISKLVRALHDQATDVYGHHSIMANALASIREISSADKNEDWSPRTREEVSTRISEHLNCSDWCVRKEAIKTLVKTVPQSNRNEVLETLVGKLEDSKIEVRLQAIECLESYTDGSDKWVISGIACRLVSKSRDVRNAAASILSKLLDAKMNATNADILQRIKQGKIPTNTEVIGLLSQIITRGDEGYLDGFLKCMRHDALSIRRLASDAIQSICIPGQACVVEEIIRNLKHESPSVKCDSMLTLSKVVLKNDDRAVQIVQDMLSDPNLEVKKVVSIALKNMLAEGDSRRTIALSCVQLDSGYHNEDERKDALEQLGQLAYASSKFRLEGWSVEDADMERFWQQIRQPRGPSNDSAKFVPKILKSLKDEAAWVRRAGVDAIMHCAKKGDVEVIEAVCDLLHDSSFAIRMAAVSALSVLSSPGDKKVTALILERLNDTSHLVRRKSLDTLKKIARVGDSVTVRCLMTFIRNSWDYVKVRGNDTDIKLEVAHLLFHLLAFKDNEKIQFLLDALKHPEMHVERDRIEYIEDFLISQNLMTRYLGYRDRMRRDLTDDSISEQAGNSGFSFRQMLLILNLQRRILKQRKERAQVFKKTDVFEEEKSSGVGRSSRSRRHASFQEQLLIHRVADKSGATSKWPQTPEASAHPDKHSSEAGTKARTQDFDWYKRADDEDAEKMIRKYVPATIRYSAVALAYQRVMAGQEGAKLWERMRWTKRLRLCEEINGTSF